MRRLARPLMDRLDALVPTGSLSRRLVKASGWSTVGMAVGNLLRLASNLILSRLLLPESFGLMLFATTMVAALSILTDVGVGVSVQREKDGEDPRFLRVAWVLNTLRGMAIGAIVVVAAIALSVFGPLLFRPDSVYAAPEAPLLMCIVATVSVMNGANSSTLLLASRQLDLRLLTLVGIAAQALSMLLMIGFALIWPTVWALAFGMVAQNLIRLVASHTIFPGPRMYFEWDSEIVGRLWRFGRWMMISTPFWFFATNADNFLLGALLTTQAFGLYSIGRLWVSSLAALIAPVASSLGMPALSDVARNRPDHLPRVIARLQRVIDLASLAAFVVVTLAATPVIRLLYPDDYQDSAWFLRILALTLLHLRFGALDSALLSLGRSGMTMTLNILNAIVITAAILGGHALFGLVGAIYAAVLAPYAVIPCKIWFCRRAMPEYTGLRDIVWLGVVAAFAVAHIATA